MNSCMRCGEKLQHNYLVTIYKVIKEKKERLIVCFKCRDFLNKKEEIKAT
jgi:uncharacterized CHY-type Zn-finger protein